MKYLRFKCKSYNGNCLSIYRDFSFMAHISHYQLRIVTTAQIFLFASISLLNTQWEY